ncbi:MAG: flagellar export chaperone FliS [Nitrococcus sp.]|nr:flagellar export chaperone FliS [Nitrococcus sp.]
MTFVKAGIAQYQKVGASGASYADPYHLTGMLMSTALDRIAQARGAIKRADAPAKGERIGKALAIVDALRTSLDHKTGGELADNLAGLYEYMQHRLLAANLNSDAGALDEVARLLREIKDGWDAIPPEARHVQKKPANATHRAPA